MINQFDSVSDYESATLSTAESNVSHIESTNEVKIDGVNVVTDQPKVGDALFLDEDNAKVYIDGDTLVKASIPSAWTHVGFVFLRRGNVIGIVDKSGSDLKYADVLQYTISAITSTSITLTLYNSSGTATTVSVTLSSAAINSTTASEINTAIQAAGIDSNDWWAYLNDDEDAIIVQCDTWAHYTQYNCAMSGGTIAFTTWGDMPASDVYFKNDGGYTNYWGVMNVARTRAWAESNGRTPTNEEPVKVTGNVAPVTPASFEDSTDSGYAYTSTIRAYYGTYDNYLRKGYGVKYPQKYGTFSLGGGKALNEAYALETAPTIDGGTKYKFPAMYNCYVKTYGVDDLDTGDWFLPGSEEGCYLLDDDTIAALATPISTMGTTAINNSTYRWFAERYSVDDARFFNGTGGYLSSIDVYGAFRTQAVTLFTL